MNGRLRSLPGRFAAVVAGMNEAQYRVSVLRSAPDRYLLRPDEPPDTYAEFLARTSGPLLREPLARGGRRRQRTSR
jgi:hypothetical protein